jgi:hypothetical protein
MATPVYSILIDTTTMIVLASSSHIPSVEFLRECTPENTAHISFVQYPHYTQSLFLRTISPEKVPQWTWNKKTHLFTPTEPTLLTDTIRARSLVAT